MTDVDGIQFGLSMYEGGKEDAIKQVLEIISQERDKTENVTHKTIENIISAVKALKGEQEQ